jgi:hypothetical protein
MTTEYLKITIIGRLGCQDPNHKSFISDYVRRLISFPRFLLSALIFSVFLLPKTLLLMKMRFLHSLSLFSFLGVATPHTIFTQLTSGGTTSGMYVSYYNLIYPLTKTAVGDGIRDPSYDGVRPQ